MLSYKLNTFILRFTYLLVSSWILHACQQRSQHRKWQKPTSHCQRASLKGCCRSAGWNVEDSAGTLRRPPHCGATHRRLPRASSTTELRTYTLYICRIYPYGYTYVLDVTLPSRAMCPIILSCMRMLLCTYTQRGETALQPYKRNLEPLAARPEDDVATDASPA